MTKQRPKPVEPLRPSLWDALGVASSNIYCRRDDLSNEASVESFFVGRMIKDLGYDDSQIKTKESIETLAVGQGHKIVNYRPDYALLVDGIPRCIVDAKGTEEDLNRWVEQCSGYCLALNRRFETNPVRFFILSNGVTTALYEWDRADPLLVLDFVDFDWGSPKYEQLKATVGVQAVSQPPAVAQWVAPAANFEFNRPTSERAKFLFAKCHTVIWKSEGYGPAPAFMEFVKVVFVKLWADRQLRDNPATKDYFRDNVLGLRLPGSAILFSEDWIAARESEGTSNPLDTILFDRLRDDIEKHVQLRKKKRLFDKGERINLRPDTIKAVVRELQHFDLFGIDEDLNGRLFETFLTATMRGRDLGQLFTPRSIAKMMTRIANLQADRQSQSVVLDACCGSGGFLIEALTVMRNKIRSNTSLSPTERQVLLDKVSNECLYGIDYGKNPPLARLARINMYLHGDGGSRIYYADGLDKDLDCSNEKDPEVVQNVEELRGLLEHERFDAVLTNPPFAMSKEVKKETDARILKQYVLGRKDDTSTAPRKSLRSSLMFLERYCDLLKPGGHLITVIDDTLLASRMFGFFRDYIRAHFLVRAIISLPGDAFRRSGSRVKTSAIVLEKKRQPDEQQPNCFAFFSEWLGVDDLTRRASDADIQEARTRAERETEVIVNGYTEFLKRGTADIVLTPDRVADRLDLKFCVPQFGRMASQWQREGIEVRRLSECVVLVEDEIKPSETPEDEFVLIRVTYGGKCEIDKVKKGRAIKPASMYRVGRGQLVFSTIRATDGAMGIVPPELDGALVSKSYSVFECGSEADTAYLWAVLRSHEIRADMQSLSPGSGRYTTYWPDVGRVLVPWIEDEARAGIGQALLATWALERQAKGEMERALGQLDALGVESEDSQRRWKASKAPT